jgi:nucleotide-binding universal stress UspA family protein
MSWHPQTVVVGYDGTSSAQAALERAVEIARGFGSTVVVADILSPQPVPMVSGAFGLTPYYSDVGDTAERLHELDETILQQHRERVESLFADIGIPHEFASTIGAPVEEIVSVAERYHADLIVVGTRDPGFFERLLGGSVSQGVARRADCDVLIVHSADG